MRHFIVLFLIVFLSSCSVFSPVKVSDENTYVINTVPQVTSHKSPQRGVIFVPEPTSNPLYNSNQIAYTRAPFQISYFSKNRWVESPIIMLQAVIIQALQNSHYYRGVTSSSYVGKYQYLLSTQLLQLQQDFSVKPSVLRFKIRAQLIRTADGQILKTKEIEVVEPTSQDTPFGGVEAANRAVAKAVAMLVNFAT